MLELNKLYNMDCMQGMKEFPDGFFDLAIVDPPYGIGIDGQKKRVCGNPKHNRKEHIRKSWDKTIPPPEYFRELERVSKAQVIWGGNYFVPYLEQGHKGWLVWDKGQHGLTMSDCELAYTSFDTPTRVFVCNRVELLNDGTIHPTQKPVKLYSWVLSLFARKGMKILDTHAGSGSSLIACYRQGRFSSSLIGNGRDRRMQKNKMPVPTEAQEQMTLFSWAAMQSGQYPELNLLYHVPNGGSRHKAEAGRLRAEGVKAGVPDLCLPVARGQYHGLYIELKRQRGGRTSDHQSEWLDALSAQGYKAALCYGWEQAAGTIIEYLTGGGTHD